MPLRLRQICLVAPTLEPAVSELCRTLGLAVCYRDPNVAKYGLENAVMPVGNTFLEVVAPTRPDTAAGRYLIRRAGAGGYMVILDTDNIRPWINHVDAVGVRIAADLNYHGAYRGLQLHPRDTGGALLEINWTHGGWLDGPYHPAGPNWHGRTPDLRGTAIVAAEIQADDPIALAARWSAILDRPIEPQANSPTIRLDVGAIRFVPAADGRGEGLGGIDISTSNHPPGGTLQVCGTRIRFC